MSLLENGGSYGNNSSRFIHYCYTVWQVSLQEAMGLGGSGGSCRRSCLYLSQLAARMIAGGKRNVIRERFEDVCN